MSAGDLHLTWVSLKPKRTNSGEIQGVSTLSPCRFQGEVATSHQDVTILQQVWHPPWFPSDTSLWQGHVVLQTKSGIYPAGHKQSSSSGGSQEGCRAIISERELNLEKPSVSQCISLSHCVWVPSWYKINYFGVKVTLWIRWKPWTMSPEKYTYMSTWENL